MKTVVLATALLALGCGGKNQGDGAPGCMPLMSGGSDCFYAATAPATRTQCSDVTDYCDTTGVMTPNLSCLSTPRPTPPATPARVTLTGFVHVFASGPSSNNVTVQVFELSSLANGGDPAQSTSIGQTTATLDPATQRACDVDPSKGCTIPLANGCTLPVCNDGLGGRPDQMKYCRDNGSGGECSDRLRWEARYTIPNIPTNTQLLLRVTGANGQPDQTWATTVAFQTFLSTADKACKSAVDTDCIDTSDAANPKYQLNVNALSQSDYGLLPVVAGLPGGITAGEGAIAGEVHDCDNVRLSLVQVSVVPAADRFVYFNGSPNQGVPDPRRATIGTDRLGLFAALNEKPGKVTITTAGALDANLQLTSFGSIDAFVYPDTVSIVNVNGGKPAP